MRDWSWRMWMGCAVAVGGAGLVGGREAAAQSYGADGTNLSPSQATPSQSSPIVPLFSPAVPSVMGNSTAGLGGTSSSNNILNNPLAAPLLYNSMLSASMPRVAASTSTSTTSTSSTAAAASATAGQSGMGGGMLGMGATQMGMMMLLANQQNGGIGSGQMSGTRPNPRATAASSGSSRGRTRAKPGGLAAKYFNRTGGHSAYPQNYFNRRPRSYP